MLAMAMRSPLICDAHEADISVVLKYVMMKVGVRANNLPGDIEKKILLDHIKKYYSVNTLDEIRLAFDLAINEELDLSPDDTKCYENFSCNYFSRIMNAYQSWAANEYKFLKQEPPPQRIFTDDELDNFRRQWTEEIYQRIRSGHVPPEIPAYVEEILIKDGLMVQGGSVINFFVYRLGKQIPHIYEKTER